MIQLIAKVVGLQKNSSVLLWRFVDYTYQLEFMVNDRVVLRQNLIDTCYEDAINTLNSYTMNPVQL